jgi:hypothetical protein
VIPRKHPDTAASQTVPQHKNAAAGRRLVANINERKGRSPQGGLFIP